MGSKSPRKKHLVSLVIGILTICLGIIFLSLSALANILSAIGYILLSMVLLMIGSFILIFRYFMACVPERIDQQVTDNQTQDSQDDDGHHTVHLVPDVVPGSAAGPYPQPEGSGATGDVVVDENQPDPGLHSVSPPPSPGKANTFFQPPSVTARLKPKESSELENDPRLYDNCHLDINRTRIQRLQEDFNFPGQHFKKEEDRLIPAKGLSSVPNPEFKTSSHPAYSERYIVLDVETTGLSTEFDDIIEFGAIRVENGQETDCFNTLIDPGYPIPPYITQLTGITDADIAGAPDLSTAIQDIAAFIGDLPVVAHNATFDLRFLLHAYQKANLHANFHYFDTLTLSKHAFPNAPNHKLSTLISYLGIDGEQEHRALSDVRFTYQIFCACRAHVDLSLFILPYPSTKSQRRKQYRARKRYYIREAACQKAAIDPNHPLYQKRILFTGTMQIPRHQAAQLAEDCGAFLTGSVSKNTDYLVVGTQDSSSSDIDNMSTKEKKAHWLNEHEDGHIQIINEAEFIKLLLNNSAAD